MHRSSRAEPQRSGILARGAALRVVCCADGVIVVALWFVWLSGSDSGVGV
jgi:hypothetical protein